MKSTCGVQRAGGHVREHCSAGRSTELVPIQNENGFHRKSTYMRVGIQKPPLENLSSNRLTNRLHNQQYVETHIGAFDCLPVGHARCTFDVFHRKHVARAKVRIHIGHVHMTAPVVRVDPLQLVVRKRQLRGREPQRTEQPAWPIGVYSCSIAQHERADTL